MSTTVFVTGGTGYLGQPLIRELLGRGHRVRALVRAGSEQRLPTGAVPVIGDALNAQSYVGFVHPASTFVHLVGTPKPSPTKAAEFQRVDLGSALAAITAARIAGVHHFVYVSVAQPAPVMHAYVAARAAAETRIRTEFGDGPELGATILRPWYVLGPGHQWPHLLRPVYAVARLLPGLRADAERLGLVTLAEMVAALTTAVESPPTGVAVMDVPSIRAAAKASG